VFESFQRARRRIALPRAAWIAGVAAAHAAFFLAAWVMSVWDVEKLDMPRGRIRVGTVVVPSTLPAAALEGAKPRTEPAPVKPRRHRVPVPVQPVALPPPPPEPVEEQTGDAGTAEEPTFGGGEAGDLPTEVIIERASMASAPSPLGRYDKLVIESTDPDSQGLRGSIVLVLEIDAHGKVERVVLSAGMADDLDAQAMQLALRFRFRPARDDAGSPIPSRVSWTFNVIPQPKTG
jgi:TonB family protein